MLSTQIYELYAFSLLSSLTLCLWERFKQTGMRRELDWVIALDRIMLDLHKDHADRWSCLDNLATARFTRYQRWRQTHDLERAVSLWREALSICPDEGHPGRSTILNNLGSSLSTRFQRFEMSSDLDESIVLHRAALALCPEGHPDHLHALNNLAVALSISVERNEKVDGLRVDEAISLVRAALAFSSRGTEHHIALLNNLAKSLSIRFQKSGDADDIGEAIELQRLVLAIRPEDHPDRPSSLHNLAASLLRQFERSGEPDDLDEAIMLLRLASTLHAVGHPDRLQVLEDLAVFLWTRFRLSGNLEDLTESIALHRAVLAILPDHSLSLSNLGNSLSTRFDLYGEVENLNEAIELYRRAHTFCPADHPLRSEYITGLARSLLSRFEKGGTLGDLDESIALNRAALVLRKEGELDRSLSLNNLAISLLNRFRHSGRVEDLNESIGLHRDALSLCSEEHPHRLMSLASLAYALWTRYEHSNNIEDLQESLALNRSAVSLYPENHIDRPMSVNNLANCLFSRFQHAGSFEDLEESIALHRAGLALRSGRHPDRSMSLSNLASLLYMRFGQSKVADDLDESITLHHAAVASCPSSHPSRSMYLLGLADALYTRSERQGHAGDLEYSMQSFDQAVNHLFSSSIMRLKAARQWSSMARSCDHHTTLDAYRAALTLLQRTLTIRPTLSTQLDFLSSDFGYQVEPVDAASYAIEKGKLTLAIALLEQGRTLLWSQMRGLRTPLDQLSDVNKALADRFAECSRRMETLITSTESRSRLGSHADSGGENRNVDETLVSVRHLAEEQEAIIREIRNIPGLENFLGNESFESLQRVASEGPVIVVNFSKFRCDTIIVLAREDVPCVCVPLDQDWYSLALDLCKDLLEDRLTCGVASAKYDVTLRRVMKVLWDKVVSRVVQKLRELGIAPGSRIWWCLTSLLAYFPFHAAGPYESADGTQKYLLDEYISSYTPTLKALINARAGLASDNPRLLFVGDSGLPSTRKERNAIRTWRRVDRLLVDDRATRDAVLRALRKVEWVHFACHGKLDKEPFNSSLKLSDGGLTLLDIARAHLPNAEFAFLSACHTAELALNHSQDEALSLAAAIQFCGFRSVVGTMWQLLDRDGPVLAGNVYACLTRDIGEGEIRFKRVAAAVREAALNLRDRGDEAPNGSRVEIMAERWVNLVHIGA
ncbi:TPR-like protein [Sanghuangporus baumii]|uniref:TPR-like protein n=1 Tax=Sanghuangporus baumii TaxID=108892 RepID=A0A9Q5N3T9_SANBA|nr:TPR-like protein [Sanghuangporus baumii]